MPKPKIENLYRLIGARIKEIREKHNLSQAGLGELLDPPVARANISNMENGKQRIPLHILLDVADVLREPITEFIQDVIET